MGNPSIWVLYDPSARGDRNAALGVAERLTENPFLVSIGAIEQAGGIGEFIRLRSRLAEVPSDPQIVISSSPPPVPYALSIKRYYSGKPFLVHLRDPIHNHKEFGLIAIPEHMPTPGRGSVCRFTGIANRVTAQRVSMEGEVWRKRLDPYNPYPKVAAMAGGSATKVEGDTACRLATPGFHFNYKFSENPNRCLDCTLQSDQKFPAFVQARLADEFNRGKPLLCFSLPCRFPDCSRRFYVHAF